MTSPGGSVQPREGMRSAARPYYTVFISTSLDTHLVMNVSDDETVAAFKEKIMCEHPSCFPNVGDIKVKVLKVKRGIDFYHLSDSIFVKDAFYGVTGDWFLFVDAYSVRGYRHNYDIFD